MPDIAVNNYLVPAVGTPRAFVFNEELFGERVLEFRSVKLDGENFVPTGVYSSQNNNAVSITIDQLANFAIALDAGESFNYPAPPDQTIRINGSGVCNLIFVNYPIIA